MDCRLFMPDQYMSELVLLENCIINLDNRAAGVAENKLDSFFLQASDYDFRARDLHFCLCLKIICPIVTNNLILISKYGSSAFVQSQKPLSHGNLKLFLASMLDGRALVVFPVEKYKYFANGPTVSRAKFPEPAS
jgi:hypothetical protein